MTLDASERLCLGCGYILDGLERPRCPECRREFDPGDPSTFGTASGRGHGWLLGILRAARPVTVPAVAAWVWWAAMQALTTGPGVGFHRELIGCVLVAVFYGAFPAAIAWTGLSWRRHVLAIVLTTLLPALVANATARWEERLFVARCKKLPPNTPTVFKSRWWPCEDHYLYYEPATGELGGGD